MDTTGLDLDRSIVPVIVDKLNDNNNYNNNNNKKKKNDDTTEKDDRLQITLLHSLHGTHILALVVEIMGISSTSTCYETASVLFHQYYYHQQHQQKQQQKQQQQQQHPKGDDGENDDDVWSIAMGSLLLAIKLEEAEIAPRENNSVKYSTIRQLIIAFVHVYRRQAYILINDENNDDNDQRRINQIYNHPWVAYPKFITNNNMTYVEKKRRLQESYPSLSITGPAYEEWHKECLDIEQKILRRLGFILYWIPSNHCSKFIQPFIDLLFTKGHASSQSTDPSVLIKDRLMEQAMTYCKLSYRINLCIQYTAEIIACAAIHLAALDLGIQFTNDTTTVAAAVGRPGDSKTIQVSSADTIQWWDILCGTGNEQLISNCCNWILFIHNGENNNKINNETENLVWIASHAYIKSSIDNNNVSFNDPGSFLWDYMIDQDDDDV